MSMNKEYRRELSALIKTRRKIIKDLRHAGRVSVRQESRLVRERVKSKVRVNREIARIDRRRAILEGRLS